MNSIFLFLNTQDRLTGDVYNSQFSIEGIPISNLLNYKISLETCEFANTVFPINSTRGNHIIYFQENNATGTTYSGTITEQEYSGTTFATEVQSILNNNTGNAYTYTVSYSSITKKLTISEAGNNPFRIVDGTYSAHREMGYDVDNETSFQSASYQLTQTIDLSGTKYVDIVSNIGTSNITSAGSYSVLYRIPVMVSFGSIVFYQNSSDDKIFLSNDNLSDFNLSLRDDRGKAFNLLDNSNISYVFKLSA